LKFIPDGLGGTRTRTEQFAGLPLSQIKLPTQCDSGGRNRTFNFLFVRQALWPLSYAALAREMGPMTGLEPATRCLQDSRSVSHLSYIGMKFGCEAGIRTRIGPINSRTLSQLSYLTVLLINAPGGTRTHSFSLKRRALGRLSFRCARGGADEI
jgi:hypothetical protein